MANFVIDDGSSDEDDEEPCNVLSSNEFDIADEYRVLATEPTQTVEGLLEERPISPQPHNYSRASARYGVPAPIEYKKEERLNTHREHATTANDMFLELNHANFLPGGHSNQGLLTSKELNPVILLSIEKSLTER